MLAWRIPRTGEPGGLLSMVLHRVRHDWSNLAAAACLDSFLFVFCEFTIDWLCIKHEAYIKDLTWGIEQIFGLYGRRRGWGDLREQHRNMYILKCETDRQPRLDARDKCSGPVHWEDPEGWGGEGGGRGIGMGNTCKPVADSCQCMAKALQYYKVISLQLIKINGKTKIKILS